jgi:hypothetical protein
MQPCNRIYYSTVQWRLNMFRVAHRSSSGARTVFSASDLHTHMVTGRSQVWVPLRLNYGRSPHAYVNQSLPIQLELLMMSGVLLEICWVELSLDYGRSPHAYVNRRLQIQSSWWWAVCRSKHVEPSMNGGIINSITRLHLVRNFSWIILRCTDPWILNLKLHEDLSTFMVGISFSSS